MLVNEFLKRPAAETPNKTALVCGKHRLSYHQIERSASKLAGYLVKNGIQRHDRVAVFLDNSAESVISLFGILKAGATFIILSATMKSAKLNYILKDSACSALITHENKHKVVSGAIGRGCSELKHVIWCKASKNMDDELQLPGNISSGRWESIFSENPSTGAVDLPESIDIDLSNIIYTSGSTGEPKGVMCAHYNVVSATRSISTYLEMNENDIIMNVLPLSFDYGLYQVFMTFFVGGTLILEKSFAYPYKIFEQLVEERVTGFPIVPTMAALVLQMDSLSVFDFSSLRFISNTAAALPMSSIEKLKEIFERAKIFSMYGLTECKRVSYLPPEDLERKPGSVGIAMPNEEVFIVDDAGNDLPPNEIGELVIRGANVMQGYWNDPVSTERAFRKGRYHGEVLLYSGDLFKKDEDGYLYFISRKDDMIKTKGERVSPKEIETLIHQINGISDVAVFGIPDHLSGQAIVAYIIPENGTSISEREIRKYCTLNLEPFMVPKHIAFTDTFPISANGKIDKKQLADTFKKRS